MKVTQDQLIDILADSDESYITVFAETPVKMNTTGNPFYKKEGRAKAVPINIVTKRYVATYGFGNYKEEIEKRLRRKGIEGSYETKPQPWKEIIVPDRVCKNKNTGEFYLMYFLEDMFSTHPTNAEKEVEYLVDGVPATDEQMRIIDEFEIHSSSNVKKQEDAGLSWEEQLLPRILKFDNIISVALGNTMYELID